jgi:hypothetical protein
MKIVFVILTLFLSLPAFGQKDFTVTGIMHHTDIEGGCWYLQANQMKYELTALPEILRTCYVDGRMLTLRAHLAHMMKSICMVGTMLEVTVVLDSVFRPHDPPYSDVKIKGTVHKTKAGCWYVRSTDKHRYELQPPIPEQFMHIGARYNRMSKLLPESESSCGVDGVITISLLEPDMIPKEAREKKNDPR